jgi:hypothetical protein
MVRIHGQWCGPNWTANQVKEAKDATKSDRKVGCIDRLDCACKKHDLDIADSGSPSFKSDTELARAAQRILNNPFLAITNPIMYAKAIAVRDSMNLVRWTRAR